MVRHVIIKSSATRVRSLPEIWRITKGDLPPEDLKSSRNFCNQCTTSNNNGKRHNQRLVETMRDRLAKDSTLNQEKGWDDLWKNEVTPWDLNVPTPALKAELHSRTNLMESIRDGKEQYYSILVPGAGSGHDLLTLASHFDQLLQQQDGSVVGTNVVGLDISLTSLDRARQVMVDCGAITTPNKKASVTLAHGDFFDCHSWRSVYCSQPKQRERTETNFKEGGFDLIYDYVFFCALPPRLRGSWGEAVSSLLKPGTGRLLTLMFPVLPDAEMNGPPYPVSVEDYQQVLEPRGVIMEAEPYPSKHTIRPRVGKELVCWWYRQETPRSSFMIM